MSAKAKLCNLGYAGLIILFFYVLVYAILSLNGEYEPGLSWNGVQEYAWAPLGFYHSDGPWGGPIAVRRRGAVRWGEWDTRVLWDVFYPLYFVDCSWIHKDKGVH
jgi:hypothetical protein